MPRDPDALRRRWVRPALIAVAAVLAVVLVLALGVVLARDHTARQAVAAASTSSAPAASSPMTTASSATAPAPSTLTVSPAPTAATQQCPRGLMSDVLPAAAPVDETWHATPMAPVPVSPTYGPYRTGVTGLPICFSHSPMGATIAVRSIDAWLFSTKWRTVLLTQVARTPGYAELLTALEAAPPDGSPETDTVVGFNVASYTPAAATIDLVTRSPNGAVNGCPVSVRWTSGDWQLTPRPDGTLTAETCPAVAPGTYVPWGPGQ